MSSQKFGSEVIDEVFDESSGSTSSLIESIFSVEEEDNQNLKTGGTTDTPASRHVKFKDEDVILNADEIELENQDNMVGSGLVQGVSRFQADRMEKDARLERVLQRNTNE